MEIEIIVVEILDNIINQIKLMSHFVMSWAVKLILEPNKNLQKMIKMKIYMYHHHLQVDGHAKRRISVTKKNNLFIYHFNKKVEIYIQSH